MKKKVLNDDLMAALREAAIDLGLSMVAPFEIILPELGRTQVEALVQGFGSPQGTVVIATDRMELWEPLLSSGYHCSALNPANYAPYSRSKFVAMLCDWGWQDKAGEAPVWLSEVADDT